MGGQHIHDLDTPAVLVDLDILERNVRRMASFAESRGVALRPHDQSHTRVGIAERQRAAGNRSVTVAKLDEAAAYLATGFDDVCVANEVVGIDKWRRLAGLRQPGKVAIGVDSGGGRWSRSSGAGCGVEIPVLIEVDSGLQRAGVRRIRPRKLRASGATRVRRWSRRHALSVASSDEREPR